ncbi:MAG: DegT/DnrJ/EryC1/StrS family aminotransferase [Clostridia bacterium]|nr:DegT/DnrJ/EryC1/StrS family aminotransferase [Clostridia bacterium]
MQKTIEWENLSKLNKPYITVLRTDINILNNTGKYTMGEFVEEFEKECCKYFNSKYAIACGNALDGLTLSLRALKIPKNSEVIVPSNTFYATALAILRNNLIPVLCEPDLNTFNIDFKNIEQKITSKTKAIICVHLYGKPCDMDKIKKIAKKYKLKIIEDGAQAFGAVYKNAKVGNLSDAGVFSFYPTKNLGGIGDAGIIITNNKEIYEFARKARSYGGNNYRYEVEGINSRMDEIQAMFLLNKFKDIEKINEKKIKNANLYLKHIINKSIILPKIDENEKHVFYIFAIRCKRRDELQKYLQENGVNALIHYPIPLNKQPVINEKKTYEIAEEISSTELSLPCSAVHTKQEIMRVIKLINKFK